MVTEQQRRKDDSFLRKILVTVSATIVIQAGGWIYLLGTQQQSIKNLEMNVEINRKNIEKTMDVNDRLIRLETKLDFLVDRIADIDKIKKEVSLIKGGMK